MSEQGTHTTLDKRRFKELKRELEDAHSAHPADEGDGNWIMSYADMMTLLMSFFALMFSFSQVDAKKFDQIREQLTKQFGGKYEMPFEDLEKALGELVKQDFALTERVQIDHDSSGVSLVFTGSVLFDAGATTLRPEAKATIERIVDVLSEKAKGYPIFVEGHTDNKPISTAMFPSNWELSGGRASQVVRMFENKGVPKALLNSLAFGDSRPIAPNQDEKGADLPENQSKNRRVVLRISRK